MKAYRSLLTLLAMACVSACGGEGSTSQPTPTPTPTSTPTPTPTPTSNLPPGCAALPADRGLVFDQVVAGMGYTTTSFGGFYAPRTGTALSRRAQDDSYLFVVPDDISAFPAPNYDGSSFFPTSDGKADRAGFRTFGNDCDFVDGYRYSHDLSVYRQGVAGSVPYLSYSSFGHFDFWASGRSSSYTTGYWFGFGSPSTMAQIPATGSATYVGTVHARGVKKSLITSADYELVGSARIEVNFATRVFSATLEFKEDDGRPADFGTRSFTNAAMPALDRLAATSSEGEVTGFLSGPHAEELVLAYTLKFADMAQAPGYQVDVQIAGAAAAVR